MEVAIFIDDFSVAGVVINAIAVVLALRSGEPAAMVGAAGMLQIGCAAANVLLVWPYMPPRDEIEPEDDDDDE